MSYTQSYMVYVRLMKKIVYAYQADERKCKFIQTNCWNRLSDPNLFLFICALIDSTENSVHFCCLIHDFLVNKMLHKIRIIFKTDFPQKLFFCNFWSKLVVNIQISRFTRNMLRLLFAELSRSRCQLFKREKRTSLVFRLNYVRAHTHS